KHRIYDILKVYHRQWVLWLTDRVAEIPDIEHHKDIVAECDFIQPPASCPGILPSEMWKPQSYSGLVLKALMDFLRSDKFYPDNEKYLTLDNLEKIEREKVLFPEAGIEELVNKHWMPWLRFFESQLREGNLALQKTLREINPQVKRSGYGPFQAYVAHGKTSHVLKYRGTILESYDGFFVFEDYPLT